MAKKPEPVIDMRPTILAYWSPTPALRAVVKRWAEAHAATIDNREDDYDGVEHLGSNADWLVSLSAIVRVRGVVAFYLTESDALSARGISRRLSVRNFLYVSPDSSRGSSEILG